MLAGEWVKQAGVLGAVGAFIMIDYVLPVPKAGFLWEVAGYQVYLSWAIGVDDGVFHVRRL